MLHYVLLYPIYKNIPSHFISSLTNFPIVFAFSINHIASSKKFFLRAVILAKNHQ